MKRVLSVLICIGILATSACSKQTTITKSSEVTVTSETSDSEQTEETIDSDAVSALKDIEVDEGLLTVTITVPADIIGETTQENVDKAVAEKGYISGTLNDDGSVTYEMTKAKHKEVLKEMADGFDETIQGIVDSDDYPHIESITHNEDFTDFRVEFSSESLGLTETLVVISFYYMGGIYGVFNEKRPDNVHVAYVNSETGEVFDEFDSKNVGSTSE